MSPDPDQCPLCGEVHGQIYPAWACPQHGHHLYLDLAKPGRDIYACPAWACRFTKWAGAAV